MSLDVYLISPECPHCGRRGEVFQTNITHNLNIMAREAGVYMACWRPEEIGITKAAQLIPILREGIAKLKADPWRFEKFDDPGSWGLYEDFVPWLEEYLEACKRMPQAAVAVSR